MKFRISSHQQQRMRQKQYLKPPGKLPDFKKVEK
jgi:hypothetical protein